MNKAHTTHYLPGLKAIQESRFSLNDKITGFHATCIDNDNRPLGSGTHAQREVAHTIAVAEAIERQIFKSLYVSEKKNEYLLDQYPSTCGFAVGNNRLETIHRSVAEAIERWLRSKWIDDRYFLVETSIPWGSLNSYQKSAISFFDSIRAFQHTANLNFTEGTFIYYSLIVVGFKGKGAFVGSKTSINPHHLWSHALTEAWRHLHISEHIDRYPDIFDYQIIHHFGQYATQALKQIDNAIHPNIPEPTLLLHKEIETPFNDLFCFRTLCKDFVGWHEKDIERFVY